MPTTLRFPLNRETWNRQQVEETVLPERRSWTNHYGEKCTPQSLAYFCEDCGEVWAQLDCRTRPWYFVLRRCEAHGEGWFGYICEPGIRDILTPELLKREFELACRNPSHYFCSGG